MSSNAVTPLFSIVTVTYNAEKVLERTLRSVAEQSYGRIEHLLIDGNSTDGTLELIRRYQNQFTQVVSEPDRGIYDAMNKGIRQSTGDYICFLNAGDTFHSPNTLQEIATSLSTKTSLARADGQLPDILYGDTAIVDEKGAFLYMRRLRPPKVLTWKSFKKGMLVCHQAFFVRRTLAQTELYDLTYRFSADFDWCIRLMKRAVGFHFTELTLVDYLNEGMTTRNHKASLKERFHIMCHHYGAITTSIYHVWFVIRQLFK
ncbi:MAG: glycosyltransferase family 2 protein [Phocaeicola sp.]